MLPHHEARLNVGHHLHNREDPHGCQRPANHQPRHPFGGHVQQRHEQPEEQQRGAEILLQRQHAHG